MADEGRKRVVCDLDVNLVKQIDDYARSMYLSRTSAVSVLCATALNGQKAVDAMSFLSQVLKEQQNQKDNAEGL